MAFRDIRTRSLIPLLALACGCTCASERSTNDSDTREPTEPMKLPSSTEGDDPYAQQRAEMVRRQIRGRGIRDSGVLEAMAEVPRHELVPRDQRLLAYRDHPLPIGHDQTISQPYVVAAMTEMARIEPGDKVLEIGTGSGYQAAVLAEMGAEVYTIEIVRPLGERAAADLERLGYQVHARIGDGYQGWPSAAPFDAVIITAAPPEVPRPLLEQLAVGGRLVAPVGSRHQVMRVITRTADGLDSRDAFPVRFVPMVGEAGGRR